MVQYLARAAAALLLLFTLQACAEADGDANPDTETNVAAEGELVPDEDGTLVIQPEGNNMAFAQTEFTVEPGQEVRLVFENTADSPAMSHNVLILDSTDEEVVNRVGQTGLEAGADRQYVPEDESVLASTDVAQPGETVEVTFTAPSEEGEYTFICTFPGHYQMMQGTMYVRS